MDQTLYQCSLQSWTDRYLPLDTPHERVQSYLTHLQTKSLSGESGGWQELLDPSSMAQRSLPQLFDSIVSICGAIAEHMGPSSQTCRLTSNKSTSPRLKDHEKARKSYAMFEWLGEADSAPATAVCDIELQPQPSESLALDETIPVYLRARNLLSDDPCRMHTYSITVQGEHVTLWYWSRSHSIRSEAFSFVQKPDIFVKVIIAFLCAGKEALGIDPNVARRCEADKRICYVYNVNGRYFKTLDAIAPVSQERITGRARRIWKVVEVRGFDDLSELTGATFVLKEAWQEELMLSEKAIQTKIFEELNSLALDLENNKLSRLPPELEADADSVNVLREHIRGYTRHFLTIATSFEGPVSCDIPEGATVAFSPSAEYTYASLGYDKVRKSDPERDSRKRLQHRTVFEEFCQTLYQIRDIRKAITITRDILKTLHLLCLVGWVHRDVSPGNILYIQKGDQERVILCDFEYAKDRGARTGSESDEKMGTPDFMAVEIQNRRLFWNTTRVTEELKRTLLSDLRVPKAHHKPGPRPPIVHHYVHDIESVFWTVFWAMTMRVDLSTAGGYAPSHAVRDIFCGTWDPCVEREEVIRAESHLSDILASEGGLPSSLQKLAPLMDFYPRLLSYAYSSIDPMAAHDTLRGFASDIHVSALQWFEKLLDCFPTEALPSLRTPTTTALKRSAATSLASTLPPQTPNSSSQHLPIPQPPTSPSSPKRKNVFDDGIDSSDPPDGSSDHDSSGSGRKRIRIKASSRPQDAKPRRNPPRSSRTKKTR